MVQSIAMAYAVHQMQSEDSLKTVTPHLVALWDKSIAVASISQLIAERTKVHTDVAFLTGLLHGIGSLYIMARAAGRTDGLKNQRSWLDMMEGWQASIGKAVLESWGFAEEMCAAVGDQRDHERKWKHDAALADVLIVSLLLAENHGLAGAAGGALGGRELVRQHRSHRHGLRSHHGSRTATHRAGA